MKNVLLAYTPFTGLGLYGGFRGNRWLRNRIKIFKQFVIPSLLNQTDQDFIHWVSWRAEERSNPHVKELHEYLSNIPDYRFVFTYSGLCFYDDKFDDFEARSRLATSLHYAMPDLFDVISDADNVDMLLVPSDDLYSRTTIKDIKKKFASDPSIQAVTYKKGWITNYHTKEVLEYNPTTNPPFFCIRYPKNTFIDPQKHMAYSGPYQSHEYVGDRLKLGVLEDRGFLVGTHGENISTHFNHPFGGRRLEGSELDQVLHDFGMLSTPNLKLPKSLRKWAMRKLPYQWQRKLRYWFGERGFNLFYSFIRN